MAADTRVRDSTDWASPYKGARDGKQTRPRYRNSSLDIIVNLGVAVDTAAQYHYRTYLELISAALPFFKSPTKYVLPSWRLKSL